LEITMRFFCGEVWRSDSGLRCVVTRINDDGWKGLLLFESGEQTEVNYHAFTIAGHWQRDTSRIRPAKPAEELRVMVVQTAAQNSVWPIGMDVLIRTKDRPGRWGVDSMPPPGSHIAYADAAKHVAEIALAYSCLFNLAAS
jgi:hypothetical protein